MNRYRRPRARESSEPGIACGVSRHHRSGRPVARVEVEERFRNGGGMVAEGSYLYPLAGEATFTDFSLWLNDEELRGETMDADKAREIYEGIVRRQKDPALLTLAGHGLVRARIFPILPGETRRVALPGSSRSAWGMT